MARILIVDDDQHIRVVLRAILQESGHQILEATDGAEGLRIVRRQAVDLLFCDLFMPGREGLETIPKLHQEFPGLPIVAMSGGGHYRQLELLVVARWLGAVQVLAKPFGQQEVLSVVGQALAGHDFGPAGTPCPPAGGPNPVLRGQVTPPHGDDGS